MDDNAPVGLHKLVTTLLRHTGHLVQSNVPESTLLHLTQRVAPVIKVVREIAEPRLILACSSTDQLLQGFQPWEIALCTAVCCMGLVVLWRFLSAATEGVRSSTGVLELLFVCHTISAHWLLPENCLLGPKVLVLRMCMFFDALLSSLPYLAGAIIC